VKFLTLDAWLAWQETLHPSAIDLGLERPGQVLERMSIGRPAPIVITVAGTNGKGSSVAMLESILLAAGYRVGCYTSPHLQRYNERIRIDGTEVDDTALCESFERIDHARGELSLTYFEFGTLAAFDLFARANLDVALLEVGLGGRLDAVNLIDADVALITAIDLDHASWLGNDRETIAREKAGIMRSDLPAVCSDPNPPQSLFDHAVELGTRLHTLSREYGFQQTGEGWQWWCSDESPLALPLPALRGDFQLQNAAGVLMALHLIKDRLPLSPQQIRQGLLAVRLSGRFELTPGEVVEIADVAHNPQSAAALAENLRQMPVAGKTLAVVAMLSDKDQEAVVRAMTPVIDAWYVAGLDVARGGDAAALAATVKKVIGNAPSIAATVKDALRQARVAAQPGDRIVIFGSFYTVAERMDATV
jgi:dihydrofolate synthase / folylpolyglutamate synthase